MSNNKRKRVFGGKRMVDLTFRDKPPWYKCSLKLRWAAASSADIHECATMSLNGEKVMSKEVLAKGMSRDFVSMRVKAPKGVLHKAKKVGDVVDILRISGKLRAWESSFSL